MSRNCRSADNRSTQHKVFVHKFARRYNVDSNHEANKRPRKRINAARNECRSALKIEFVSEHRYPRRAMSFS